MTLKPFGQFIDRLRELATASPDTTAVCRYFGTDEDPASPEPNCIVGHGLAELGVRPGSGDAIFGPDGREVGATHFSASLLDWNAAGLRKPTRKQSEWVQELQSQQDSSEPWGQALANADEYIRDFYNQ